MKMKITVEGEDGEGEDEDDENSEDEDDDHQWEQGWWGRARQKLILLARLLGPASSLGGRGSNTGQDIFKFQTH